MPVTFVHCQSCGGRTQINPRLPADDQKCIHCGKRCGGIEDDFHIPSAEKIQDSAAGYVAAAREAGTCPHCFADVVIDTARDIKKQRCHACGHKLIKKRRINQEKKADAPEAESVLFKRAKERVWLPMAGVVLVVVLAATWLLWMYFRPETKNAGPAEVLPPTDTELISSLIARFAAAGSPEEVLPLVREPQKSDASVRKWFAAHPGPIVPGGVFLHMVSRRTALGSNLCQVAMSGRDEPVLLAETKDGWRVEWRAFAAEGDMTVAEFAEKRPQDTALVLAVVQRSTYYNDPYASSNVWQSVYLTGKKGDDGFHAFASRSDPAVMAKLNMLPPSERDGRNMIQTSRRMAFRLRFTSPEAAKFGLAEIVSIEGDGWFIP